ncbi:MAG TPA: hypothetical protein VFS05_04185 [Gemmatimonadaceae bacterium]|nr:hypothetical protein [Gemmatimonadaceae bacterium]
MNEQLALLVAYLDADLAAADRLVARLAQRRDLPPDVAASRKGHTLHNRYGALERLFERIARTFENQVEDPSQRQGGDHRRRPADHMAAAHRNGAEEEPHEEVEAQHA